ncbi:hypothetical protein FEF26_07365 [Nesterenkonia salmonea]|uniref:Uncharacterized protein n=1 Tax=Nesterenkonia salmonea TaxID=1804987 RepID=A0A5R9BC72_9MICC|nr:hypothetical protein [Nesterenkonia salmonea]TLP97416.1 hypothetical protein FEF26_07365 [Nesterenkonia salmonea]
MILNPHTVFHAGTVPIELERAAEAYDAAAGRLRGVLARLPDYLGELDRAEDVNWDSMASDAYRAVLGLLRLPAEVMIVEVSTLAAQANAIAADLRYYAQQARTLLTLLSAGSGIPLGDAASGAADQFTGLWHEARGALEGHASRFTEFIDRHGGIPSLLHEDLRGSILPG